MIVVIGLGLLLTAPESSRGLEIAREAEQRDTGWRDLRVDLEMTLRKADGREVVRRLRSRSLEVDGDGDKTLVVFDRPRDVKGTAFLSHTHKRGNDDQWLYLPALRRVKRISSSNRSGPFMGSEFAFEDIASEELERYTYRFVREAPACLESLDCWVIERRPVDENSGYTRQLVWIDQAEYRTLRTDFYDRKGVLAKRLVRTEFVQVGKYWRAQRWSMTNLQNGRSTDVAWSNYKMATGLTEADFDKAALARAR